MTTKDETISLTSYDQNLLRNASSNPPTVVPFVDIEKTLVKLLSSQNGIDAIFASQKAAFENSTIEAKERGISSCLPIQTAGQPPQPSMKAGEDAQLCIKTGYTKNGEKMVSKVAAGGIASGNTGVVFVFDQSTLRLSTVLCDEGLLTEVRTAAACAYASKLLLGTSKLSRVGKIGIVGGGVQAVWQLRLLQAGVFNTPSTSCRTVVIKTRSKNSANAFIEKMKTSSYLPDREWIFEHYISVDNGGDAFRQCNLIHTLTPSRQPVLQLDDVCLNNDESSFLHITAVGADSPGKCEIHPDLIQKADTLICDSIPQSRERGEFQSDQFWSSMHEIGSMTELKSVETEGHFTIFDSSGLPLQDVEMANLISTTMSF